VVTVSQGKEPSALIGGGGRVRLVIETYIHVRRLGIELSQFMFKVSDDFLISRCLAVICYYFWQKLKPGRGEAMHIVACPLNAGKV
jgi:hypothetical protein